MSVGTAITMKTRAAMPRVSLPVVKNAVLGPSYRLSLAFLPPANMAALNRTYRGKDRPTDVLAFPLSDREGEIVICLSEARRQARLFGRTYRDFIVFLFIHACVHLKGYDHGAKMEKAEERIRRKFKV